MGLEIPFSINTDYKSEVFETPVSFRFAEQFKEIKVGDMGGQAAMSAEQKQCHTEYFDCAQYKLSRSATLLLLNFSKKNCHSSTPLRTRVFSQSLEYKQLNFCINLITQPFEHL